MVVNIVETLEQNRTGFLSVLAGVTDGDAAARPATGGWSVLECAEHVIIVEKRFFAFLARADRLPEPRIEPEKEAAFVTRLSNRETKVDAPEAVLPTGRFTTVVDAVAEFNDARDRVIRFAEKNQAELYRLSATHPKFGVLNGVEILLFIAGHAARHAEQMRDALASRVAANAGGSTA
jgi:hypothetical protein